jgi:nitrate/TMAO reductase-like tetraheme cytochrome c subunit
MESQPGKGRLDRPKRRFSDVIRWILLWGTIFGISGVALVAVTNKVVIWSSSNAFCGTACHSMTWASAGYRYLPREHAHNATHLPELA